MMKRNKLIALAFSLCLSGASGSLFSINVTVTQQDAQTSDAHAHCFLVAEGLEGFNDQTKIVENYYPDLEDVFKHEKFTGAREQVCTLTAPHKKKLTKFIFVGIGNVNKTDQEIAENTRRAVGTLVNKIKHNNTEATLYFPAHQRLASMLPELAKQASIAAQMADYKFDTYKSNKTTDNTHLALHTTNPSSFKQKLDEATIIGAAVNQARHWDDLPANILTPAYLAAETQRLALMHNCHCTVLQEHEAEKLGMNGFLAVGRGTVNRPHFIALEYRCDSSNAPTIALVGKGVVFDAGGLNIKTADGMLKMKYDMCGGAAVINALFAAAQLKPNVNVVALVPAVENKLGDEAYRPSDIITFMNGKTAEIGNTDAEGRVILADALCYAEKMYAPDVIIDVATLTGACPIALGVYHSGLLTNDDHVANDLQKASFAAGDHVWRLPLTEDMKAAIKPKFADLYNMGLPGYNGGTIVAGLFLSNFVDHTPWAHLDIASTAWNVPGISYLSHTGATGSSIRLLIEYIMRYSQNS